MKEARVPVIDRLLLNLIRGPGAEFVVGDVVQRYADDLASGMAPGAARRRLHGQCVSSVVHWFRPSAMARRRRERYERVGVTLDGTDGGGWEMGSIIQDLRIAARSLMRRRGFALRVALTLALGIAATTTMYSVVDGVMLRPLDFEDSEALVAVGTMFPDRQWEEGAPGLQHLAGTSLLNFMDIRERARTLESLGAVERTSILLPDIGDGPELATAASVTPAFFDALRISPALGRLFLSEEHLVREGTVMLITYGAWHRRYGGDPGILGRPLDRIGLPATIVGVLPRDFRPPEAFFSSTPDFWMPLQTDHARYANRGGRSLSIVGRLVGGATVEEARVETKQIAADLARDFPDGNVFPNGSWFGIGVNELHAHTVGTSGRALWIFMGASALLLLLAMLNAATLLLARGLDRVQELGVRVALGAGCLRIGRLLLAEAGLISAIGGVIGVGLAYLGVDLFLRLAPNSIPRTSMVAVDGRVLAVAAMVSIVVGLGAGLLPAIRLSGRAPWERLRSASRSVAQPGTRLRTALVGGQLALAVVLLSGASLLFSSFLKIRSVEPGFAPDGLFTMSISLKRPGAPPGEEPWQAWELALDEVGSVPGVVSVAGTSDPPYRDPSWAPRVLLPGDTPDTWRENIAGYVISPGYLETVGTRLLEGRDLDDLDGPTAQYVALVNETFVRTQMDGGDPLGIVFTHSESGGQDNEIHIVGVVEDVVQARADQGPRSAIYVPYTQVEWPQIQVMVRSALPTEVLVPELRRAVARFNPIVPPSNMRTMRDRMAATRTTPRFQAMLFGAFALIAMLLAAAGLGGSLAHAVGRRRRELGVRMALGAERQGVMWMVLTQGMRVSLGGLAVGILGALAATRVLAGFLYEVEPTDPLALGAVSVVLLLVSVGACLIPARRATSVDPVSVLRSE